ncbi:hypothetical protein LTR37_006676 [Vermiconidia calcicola]|uniref:Uncharacterized protein n=1 Tax=Vermiconidia calcicola TaxID=1690605 RepID=A0ACC3NH28_9PEZI|nr:hypothetical protein LTR37_006676 [Vermiconidia calcicola]
MLDLVIIPPFPRSVEAFVQVRSNVHRVVEALNKSKCDIFPKLSVRLEHQLNGGGSLCGHNDFAMLMGPLLNLRKPCRALMIYRTTGFYTFSPRIEEQCDLIETAVTGSQASKKQLAYQQLMIDLKLPLCLQSLPTRIERLLGVQTTSPELDGASRANLLVASLALSNWHRVHSESKPRWLVDLLIILRAKATPSQKLIDQACGGVDRMHLLFWAAGLETQGSPFWER